MFLIYYYLLIVSACFGKATVSFLLCILFLKSTLGFCVILSQLATAVLVVKALTVIMVVVVAVAEKRERVAANTYMMMMIYSYYY